MQLKVNHGCSKLYSKLVSAVIVHLAALSVLGALDMCHLLIGNELREVHNLLNDHKKP